METTQQLISYIAHAAPATRRPATGREPFLRPEIGFTPRWYHAATGGTFGAEWHTNPACRRDAIVAMAKATQRRFGRRADIGILQDAEQPLDLLTGTFGALLVPGIFGVPIKFQECDWPWTQHGQFLDDAQVARLEPPDLKANPFWHEFLNQVAWIARENGRVVGFMNWQSVLNNAYRLRGEDLFTDMIGEPERVKHLFACVTQTMIDGLRRLYERQRASGVELGHATISNCLVNLLSPEMYAEFVLPCDRRVAEAFSAIGVHNCAWNADPYVPHYATLPEVAYIDMGLESDLPSARAAFPQARRALMYTPMDVKEKTSAQLRDDFERIARDYGPCDIVFADIDLGVPDARVHELIDLCGEISDRHAARPAVS